MNEPNPNTTESKPRYKPLPDGLYNLTILEVKRATSKKGHQMATVVMSPMRSDHQAKRVYYNIILEDEYLKYSRSFFEALGLSGHNVREFDFSQLAGRQLRAVVKTEEKEGVLRQKFLKFLPYKEDCRTIPVFSEDLPPQDVPLSDVVHYGRHGTLVFRAFKYRGEKDNRKAFDRSRKLISVLNHFVNYLRDHYEM